MTRIEFIDDLKVVIIKRKNNERNKVDAGNILEINLVETETGKALGKLRDFRINVPLDNLISVDANFLISGIEIIDETKGEK